MLLGVTHQTFRGRCREFRREMVQIDGKVVPRQLFDFASLPADYQASLQALLEKQHAPTFQSLLEMRRVETRKWEPSKKWLDYKPTVRKRAEDRHAMLQVWYASQNAGMTKTESNRRARNEFERITGRSISDKQVYRWVATIDERGGEFAPIEAYCDEKECPHQAARLNVPEEFLAAAKSKALEPGVLAWSAAIRFFELEWANGRAVPGIGSPSAPGQPFPYTAQQLRKYAPSKAARMQAGRGKFAAKSNGLLAALPVGSAALGLRQRIVFDDKRLDIVALRDLDGAKVEVMLYIAMDESTRQILGYLLREQGGVRQTDVEALTAFVLRVCGFGGTAAGYPTTLKFERGTVAISEARQRLLEMMFPGQLIISRTAMVGGHNAAGDYSQSPTGNFFGKAKLESFMATLDRFTAHIPGQRGNVYRNTPLMLGDLLLSAERMASPQYKRTGSMLEDAIQSGQLAQAVHFVQTGALPGAFEASKATGIKGPLLYVSELNMAIQAAIAYYNAQRGHRREGYLEMPMVQPDGRLIHVRESANDKAARLERELAAMGRSLTRISEADAAVLLHKVRKITVKANGALVRINGRERRYWSESSVAIAQAQKSTLGEKEFLALYNPEDPRELYLLHNPVSHYQANAEALQHGDEPHFFEALPLMVNAEITDEVAMAQRAQRVAAANSRVGAEIVRDIVPFLAAKAERQERSTELAEPLRAAVAVLRDESAKHELPPTALASELQAEVVGEPTRLSQREAAKDDYHASLGSAEDLARATDDEM